MDALRRLFEGWREHGAGPAYSRLAQRIRYAILDGRVPLGVKLPGERRLADQLGVARITVSHAYDLLREEGYVSSQSGSGSITALPCGSTPAPLGSVYDPSLLDMAASTVPAHPYLAPAYRQAMESLPALLPTTGYETRGLDRLCVSVSETYRQAGVAIDVEDLLITQGAQHALALVLRAFLKPGDRVAIEQPSYPNAIEAFVRAGAQLKAYPVETDGWAIDELVRDLGKGMYKIAYLIPDHQNPTGAVMSARDRERVIDAARKGGALVIFDECIREIWFERPPPIADPPSGRGHVLRLGSVSKLFWGGLRIGWIAGPRALIDQVHAVRASIDLGAPPLEQLTTQVLLSEFEDAADLRRAELRDQHDYLNRAVLSRFPDWQSAPIKGGLALWLRLPGASSTALAGQARDLGLKLEPGHRFTVHGGGEQTLRLPYAREPEVIDTALDLLSEAWSKVEEGARALPVRSKRTPVL